MNTKDHNYLKNVYLQTFIYKNNLGHVIESFDFITSCKPSFKKQVTMMLEGRGSNDKKWDRMLNPKNFAGDLKTVLDKLKSNNS